MCNTRYVYQHFLFDFPFDDTYRRLLFFILTRYVCTTLAITSLCWKGSHLLRELEQKGMIPGTTYIRSWYVYQHFLLDFPFDEIYRRLLFFTLTRYGCATPGTYTNIFFLIFRLMTYTDVCFSSLLSDTYVQHLQKPISARRVHTSFE